MVDWLLKYFDDKFDDKFDNSLLFTIIIKKENAKYLFHVKYFK